MKFCQTWTRSREFTAAGKKERNARWAAWGQSGKTRRKPQGSTPVINAKLCYAHLLWDKM